MLAQAPRGLTGRLTWRLVSEADGSVAIAESSDDITAVDLGGDSPRYDRPYTAPSEEGPYRSIWRLGGTEQEQRVVVAADSAAAFATTDDVAARLGRALTTGEQNSVDLLLKMAAAVIADAASKDDGWVVTLSPVPRMLWGLSIQLAVRALANPNQLSALREQLGQYQYSAQFRSDAEGGGLTLTDVEALIVRRTVYGRTSDSVKVGSVFQEADLLLWWQRWGPLQWIQ